MKKILHSIFGILIVLALFIALSGLYIRSENNEIAFLVVILYSLSVAALLIHKYVKNKQIKIGSWIASILCTILTILFLNDEISNLKLIRTQTVYEKMDKLQERESTMRNEDLSLLDRVNEMDLNHITNNRIIVLHAFPIQKFDKQNVINSLVIKDLKINKYHDQKKIVSHTNSFFHFITNKGSDVKINLRPPYNGDSTVLIGYLSKIKMYLIAKAVAESGIDYEIIDIENGGVINGIPMWVNNDIYSGFVHFRHSIGYLEIEIKLWEKVRKGLPKLIYDEIIPTGQYLDNYDNIKYALSDFKWNKSTFSFILSYDDKIKTESTLVKIKILDYKMD